MSDEDMLDTLRAALQAGPPLRLAVLFGSVARGQRHAASDVDIGIVPLDPSLPLARELDLQAALERACGASVDLVRLDSAPIALRWRVVNEAIVLLAAPGAWASFLARAASEHADFAPALERAAAVFARRLATGSAR